MTIDSGKDVQTSDPDNIADTRPVFIYPPMDRREEVRGLGLSFAGLAFKQEVVHIYELEPGGGRLLRAAAFPINGFWLATALFWASGPKTFVAQYPSNRKDSVPVQIDFIYEPVHMPAPTIERPDLGELVEQQVLLGGKGSPSAIVRVYRDFGSDVLGTSVVGDEGSEPGSDPQAWRMPLNFAPGVVSLTATQSLQGKTSPRSVPLMLKVRPPALTAVTVTHPTVTSVKFSGNGHSGATVDITGGPAGVTIPAVQVSGGRWEVTATNWPFGDYQLTATQKVSDNAGGWISSPPYSFDVSKTFPEVSDVQYTRDYRPTLSGKGLNGATVNLFDPGGVTHAVPDTVVGSDGRWSSRATQDWGPTWERPVHIRQVLNGQASGYFELEVTIAPLAPTLNAPVENEMSPNLSGTCWPGAVINLTFSDSSASHPVNSNGSNWSFRRPAPFAADVKHKVTVTQTAARQTSTAVTAEFVVYAPIPKPGISAPANNAQVGRDLTVRGTGGMAGATMQLHDAQFTRPLGAPKQLGSNGDWSIDLTTLEFRRYTIEAQQTRNGRPSLSSERVMFQVVLLPPVIEVPEQGAALPRTSVLSGTGMPGGQVEIRLQGQAEPLLRNLVVGSDGHWRGEVSLPVGHKVLTARQTFETQTSSESTARAYRVVPAPPFIETPAVGERVGRKLVVSGFGVPGDTVTARVTGGGRSVQQRSAVRDDRSWSVTLEVDGPGGTFEVVAVASSEGFASADSAGRPIQLGTFMPSLQQPAPGRWVSHPVIFQGFGRPGSGRVMSWYNPDVFWTAAVTVTEAGWQGVETQALPAGANWIGFSQLFSTDPNGEGGSDRFDSERFEVLPESR